MKDKMIIFLILLVFVVFCILRIFDMFGGLEVIERLGGGSLLLGILKIPFCLWGGLQIIRAIYTIIGKDLEYIAKLFGTDITRNIAFAADIVLSLLGVYFMVQYWGIQ